MLLEPIILVFIKLMGTAISGHWDLRDTGTTRDYDTLARFLGGRQGQTLGGSHTKTSYSRQWAMRGCQNGCVIKGGMCIYLILLHRLC